MGKGFAALLVAAAEPILTRILLALGIGIISYTGFSVVLDQLRSSVSSTLTGLAGFGHMLGIIFGGFTARIALQSIRKLGMLKK